MKTILFILFFGLPFVGLNQQVNFEENFSNKNWFLVEPTARLSAYNRTLSMTTASKGSSTLLSNFYID